VSRLPLPSIPCVFNSEVSEKTGGFHKLKIMSEKNSITERLFRSYLNGTLNSEERKAFFRLITEREKEDEFLALLMDAVESVEAADKPLPSDPEVLFREMMEEARNRKDENTPPGILPAGNRRWWLIAAGLIIPLGLSLYLLWQNIRPAANDGFSNENFTQINVPPGGNKAILTFNDGSQVILDTVSTGPVYRQAGIEVVKQGAGLLEYHQEGKNDESLVYHTITTPKGGQYQIVLSDGTQVWINAASSMRFPASFAGKTRKVFVTGEVYFEVKPLYAVSLRNGKPGKLIPFEVEIEGKGKVEVLGTSFNINSYAETRGIKTTLLEGSVRFTPFNPVSPNQGNHELRFLDPVVLIPGQQAITNEQGQTELISGVDPEGVLAWKNGYFRFSSSTIQEVMDQIARWYGISVVIDQKMADERFSGKIQLDLNLAEVLKILGKNDLAFRMEENIRFVRSM